MDYNELFCIIRSHNYGSYEERNLPYALEEAGYIEDAEKLTFGEYKAWLDYFRFEYEPEEEEECEEV